MARRWATKAEAAEYARVSPRTIDRWFNRGHINRYGGTTIRVDLNEIDKYLTRNTDGKAA